MRTNNQYSRQQAIELYRRVKNWERSASNRLREQVLVRYFSGCCCCLHNWMINYEEGRGGITPEAYKAGRFYNWKQRQIWDVSKRLETHFAKYF